MALEALRKVSKGWVAGILVGLLVLSFAAFGISDIFNIGGPQTLASVGKSEITSTEYSVRLNQEINNVSRANGINYSYADARRDGLDNQILGVMIQNTTLDEAARLMQIEAADDIVANEVRAMPEFSDASGRFSEDRYLRALQSGNIPRKVFEQDLRRSISREMIAGAVGSGFALPEGYFDAMFAYHAQQRTIDYVVLNPSILPPPEDPPADELKKFYEENQARFRRPEYRKLKVVLATPARVGASMTPTEEEITRAYDKVRFERAVPGRRSIERLIYSNEADAKAAIERIEGGATFAEEAEHAGVTPASTALEDIVEGKNTLDPAFSKAIFDTEETGLIEEPVKGALSWAVIDITNVVPRQEPALADVRDEIVQAIKAEKGRVELLALRDDAEDLLAQGDGLDAIAQNIGVDVEEVDAVAQNGFAPNGSPVEMFIPAREVLTEAFSIDVDYDSDVINLSQGGFGMVRVTEITPSVVPPFEEIEDQVKEAVLAQKQAGRLKDFIAETLDEHPEYDLAALAKTYDAKVETTQPLLRQQASRLIPPALLQKLFDTEPGEIVFDQNLNEGVEIVVASVKEVTSPAEAENAERLKAVTKQRLTEGMVAELQNQYVFALQNKYQPKVNQRILNAITESQ